MHAKRATCLTTALLLVVFCASLLPRSAFAQSGDWSELAPGIDYRVFQPSELTPGWTVDPVHVTRMDRSNPNVTLDTTIAGGYIQVGTPSSSNLWTGAGMDKHVQYWDGAINAWGDLGTGGEPYWGTTSTIVAAINGGYWDTSTFIPSQGQFQSGWYNWKYRDNESWSGFVYKMNKEAFIGGCIKHNNDEQNVLFNLADTSIPPDYGAIKFLNINVPRPTDPIDARMYLYTPHYGLHADQSTPDGYFSSEVVIRMAQPLTNLPDSEMDISSGEVITGTVVDIRTTIPSTDEAPHSYTPPPAAMNFDEVIVSGYGDTAGKLLREAQLGEVVAFNVEIYDGTSGDCLTPTGASWTKTYAAIGGGQTIVNNGEPVNINAGVAPRTAIGYNAAYIYFVVAEGHPVFDEDGDYVDRTGISLFNLGKFMDELLGADYGMNLDGGGSSTMVVDGSTVTHSTDLLYCPQTYIPSIQKPAAGLQQAAPLPSQGAPDDFLIPNSYRQTWNPYTGSLPQAPNDPLEVEEEAVDYAFGQSCHRRVPNGIAMVVVNPMQQSQAFTPPDLVAAIEATPMRQGPGGNYASFGPLPLGTITQIADPGSGLNGVYATGTHWWYIEFNGTQGWVDERDLVPYGIYRLRLAPEGP